MLVYTVGCEFTFYSSAYLEVVVSDYLYVWIADWIVHICSYIWVFS